VTPAAQGAQLQRLARPGWPAPPHWLLWLTLVLVLAGMAWTFSVVQRMERSEQEMARRAADSLAEAVAARELAAAAEAQSKDLAARLGLAELRLSEVALQRSQLEELMLAVARTRDDSLVHDLEASVRFAQQQSQLSGSVLPLISALRGAEQRIARAAQPRLNPVQRAIAADIERLQAAQWVDVPALAQRLDGLAQRVDQWPLLNQPLPSSMAYPSVGEPTAQRMAPAGRGLESAQAGQAPLATAAAQAVVAAPEALPAAAPPVLGSTTAPAVVPAETAAAAPSEAIPAANEAAPVVAETPIWERAWGWVGQTGSGAVSWLWQQVRQSGADLVRISRIDQPEAALLAPEQAYFLRENIRLKLLSARLGLMARQFDAARADVQTVQTLVQRYFDPAATETQRVLDTLAQLQIDMQQPELPRPDATLAALQTAAGGR
jgi:uroporphyrin-3 C-methyltransferase